MVLDVGVVRIVLDIAGQERCDFELLGVGPTIHHSVGNFNVPTLFELLLLFEFYPTDQHPQEGPELG